jgi:hypothetical protein
MGKIYNAYNILDRKPEGRVSDGKPVYGRKDNIEIDLKKMGCNYVGGLDGLLQDRPL